MILFLKDWEKYPGAIVDLSTENKSFVRLAGLYKKMGIKNHSFLLALHNPDLRGVDPHSENLTEEQMIAIANEIHHNPWYFFREVARAPSISGVTVNRFRANRANIGAYWSFFNHVTTMLIQPRQTGKSFSTDILMNGLFGFWTFNTDVALVTKDIKLRVANIERLKEIQKALPTFLRMSTKKDADNTETITVRALGNSYTTYVGRSSEKDARNVMRGTTIPIQHYDEFGFINNIEFILPAALAAGGAARDAARASGSPYGTILTTTAARKDTKSGKFAWSVYVGGAPWTEMLFDLKNQKELENMVVKHSSGRNPLLILDFNHRQLGYTDEWLKNAMSEAMADGIDAETDFLNIWSSGTDKSPIPKEILDALMDSRKEPVFTEISEQGYILNWYVPEQEKHKLKTRQMVLGLDTSDAVGNDGIGFYIRDVKTGATLATGNYNETNLITFSEFIFNILKKHTKSVLVIERRSSGATIIDNLILLMLEANMDPFKKIFNWVVDEALSNPNRYSHVDCPVNRRERNIYDMYRKHFGFATSSTGRSSRDKLYGSSLISAVKYTGPVTYDKSLIGQISGLSTKNGRVDHDKDGNDDMVIAYMLTWWFLTNAKNLEFYGFSKSDPLSDLSMANTAINNELKSKEEKRIQMELRDAIEDIFKSLAYTKDNLTKTMLVTKLKYLSKYLDTSFSSTLNINNRLKELKLTH